MCIRDSAWNIDGKSPSIWDTFTQTKGNVHNDENANIIKMKSSRSIQIKNNENEDLFYTVNLFYKKLGLK